MFMTDDYSGCHHMQRGVVCFSLLLIATSRNKHLNRDLQVAQDCNERINKKPHVKLLIVCGKMIMKTCVVCLISLGQVIK